MEYQQRPRRGLPVGSVLVVLVIGIAMSIATLLISTSATVVQPGTVGIIVRLGQVLDVRQPGLSWRMPLVDSVIRIRTVRLVYEASDYPETSLADYKDYSVDSSSSDGQMVKINYTIRFHIKPELATAIIQNFNNEERLVERVVKADTRSYVRNIAREFRAIQLYSGDIFEYQERITEALSPIFDGNYLILDEVLIRSVGFDPEYVQAVEQKQIALETVTTRKHEAEQAEWEAQRDINKAKGEAGANVERAKGEAEAITRVGASLKENPQILQLRMIEALTDPNSKVKVLLMDSQGMFPILDLSKLALEEEQP